MGISTVLHLTPDSGSGAMPSSTSSSTKGAAVQLLFFPLTDAAFRARAGRASMKSPSGGGAGGGRKAGDRNSAAGAGVFRQGDIVHGFVCMREGQSRRSIDAASGGCELVGDVHDCEPKTYQISL
jgi:hypothetical protein